MASDLLPWWDQVDWQADPKLAYLKGLQDGWQLGRDESDRDHDATLAEVLSGGRTRNPHEAVRVHLRLLNQQMARAAADR